CHGGVQARKAVVWEVWRPRKDAAALVSVHPHKREAKKRIKTEIAQLVADLPRVDR
ncbi:hypothetical protein L914_11830, partial [Phytophthora nicotianae]